LGSREFDFRCVQPHLDEGFPRDARAESHTSFYPLALAQTPLVMPNRTRWG
jgi:hypothetical protein